MLAVLVRGDLGVDLGEDEVLNSGEGDVFGESVGKRLDAGALDDGTEQYGVDGAAELADLLWFGEVALVDVGEELGDEDGEGLLGLIGFLDGGGGELLSVGVREGCLEDLGNLFAFVELDSTILVENVAYGSVGGSCQVAGVEDQLCLLVGELIAIIVEFGIEVEEEGVESAEVFSIKLVDFDLG